MSLGIGFSAEARPASQSEIMAGFLTLLKSEFSTWDAKSIYFADRPDPQLVTSINLPLFIQVTPGGGDFNQSILAGGPRVEETTLIGVTIWRRSQVDRAGESYESLMNSTEGLLKLKGRVLKALSGKMLTDVDGKYIATGTIKPMQALEPDTGSTEPPMDRLALYFQVPFDWDLS